MVTENGMVMMTEQELDRMRTEKKNLVEEYERRLELMQEAIKQLMKKGGTSEDVRVSKADFVAIYNNALNEMFDIMERCEGDETPDDITNDIYGHDFTVHWHGIYCNCGDGAAPSNYLIPGIEGIYDEDPTEY